MWVQAPPAIVNVALPSSSEIIALLGASHDTKPDPTLVPVFRLRAAMVQPIPVPIPAPWVGVARTQPVPAPLQQSEGCKVSTSTPARAKASQPRLLATTQATSRSLPPLSGCDVIVSGVLSPPSWPWPSTKPFKSLHHWPCSRFVLITAQPTTRTDSYFLGFQRFHVFCSAFFNLDLWNLFSVKHWNNEGQF